MPKLSLAKLERHLYGAADILRREGMDAATYKDFIFGMLFLKRCSDIFETEKERIIQRKMEQGVMVKEKLAQYVTNPDYYDDFFVPEHSQWSFLVEKLNDRDVVYGSLLDKALSGLSESNDSLQNVLDHIQFMKIQGTKRIVSDKACQDLVRHFSRYRLRNEDFQFTDLLGSAYEFLINMFAESAGKKGGDFYTPRDVIRLMVRCLDPRPGMSIYDPTCGSGGMLIISREYVDQSGGDATNLRLCGQVNDPSAWSICKINMLLHGIRGADIRLEDTLLHPLHREGGELERFDRVIANPPFSQNYTKDDMEFPERFRWGWCPTSGKKGDLMFAQHMLAVCKPKGMMATVMPHGVLFRGGEEKKIRKKFLEEDLIEAVIGLPQNLFYGAGIPACILIMRPNLTGSPINPNKLANRRGRVLFINADAEFLSGRAQNYLRPEDIEKIASTFDSYENVPGYACSVPVSEIADPMNDFNLNIRRYVDNSPPPEPHDVRAHLIGGVPVAEIKAKEGLYNALAFDHQHAFKDRENDDRYADFADNLSDRAVIRTLVESDPGIQERVAEVHRTLTEWWSAHAPRLTELPVRRNLNAVRSDFLKTFGENLLPLGVLDRFKLSGIIAAWWTDTLPDLKTLIENDFPGVVDGWIDAIADALEDDDSAGPAFDPFNHKLVRRTMADYLEKIEDARDEISRLKGEKEAFEQSNPPEDADEEELASWNYAKHIEQRIRELKAERRDAIKELAKLERTAAKRTATETDKELARKARLALAPVFDEIESLNEELKPYEEIKAQLSAARAVYRQLINDFLDELRSRCASMSEEKKKGLVLELFEEDMEAGLNATMNEKRQELVRFIEGFWDKYRVTLNELHKKRERSDAELRMLLREMAYE
ncbi:MAG: putative type I restriction enzymeP M protein [Syntrophorhabdus sp. PtaU1.Bin002]|nr:MAG: putative type I restriction enzymeP M protein [Syntrophorhabdus sp. PtaU1.Bin002]